jgi:hypothetical protein
MSFFSHKRRPEETVVILEIGSGSIGGAFVRLAENQPPNIIFSTREQISFLPGLSPEKFIEETEKTLTKVCQLLAREGLRHLNFTDNNKEIHRVYYALSSPWCVSESRSHTFNDQKSFVVTKDFLNNLIKTELDKVETDAKKIFSEMHFGEIGRVFEKKVIQITLNGYKTTEPIGKTADNLEVALLISISPEAVFERLNRLVLRYFPTGSQYVFSFNLSAFSVLRDMYTTTDSFMFMDMSSELTEIQLVRNGILSGGFSFPLGRNSFVRKVAAELRRPVPEVFSLFALFRRQHLDREFEDKFKRALNYAFEVWLMEFRHSVNELAKEIYIPNVIVKPTNDDFGYYFAEKLSAEKFNQMGLVDSNFELVPLDADKLSPNCTVSKNVQTDVFMRINAIFMNKMYNLIEKI